MRYLSAFSILFLTVCSVVGAAEAAKKPLVAVLDFKSTNMSLHIAPGVTDVSIGHDYVDLLNSELITALVNDRSFDVVERERLKDLEEEKKFAGLTTDGMAQIGHELHADYLVYGDIELLDINKRHQQMNGFEQDQLLGQLVVNLRIVDVASSRIRYAQKVNYSLTAGVNQYSTVTAASFAEKLKAGAVQKLVSEISESISPIQVRAVRGEKVYLNRGEQAFSGGELLEIVKPVDTIYDVDGSVLDVVEDKAGVVRVESVRSKVTIAVIVEQKMPIEVGFIARRIEE